MIKYIIGVLVAALVLVGVAAGSTSTKTVTRFCVGIQSGHGVSRFDLNTHAKHRLCIVGKRGPRGLKGAAGTAGAKGDTGAKGAQGIQGVQGEKGDPGTPAPTMLRLSGDFSQTNASVATSLDGVTFGPYANGGNTGGSVEYTGANGMTLGDITELSYKIMHSSSDDSPISTPYLRIFLNNDNDDVIFDATQCAATVPAEDTFQTFEVVGSGVRYNDDSCDGAGNHNYPGSPAGQQTWASVLAHHSNEVISGIYVSAGFAGGADLSAILRSLSVNDQVFTFGAP
jgi:hypothetical protein